MSTLDIDPGFPTKGDVAFGGDCLKHMHIYLDWYEGDERQEVTATRPNSG